MIPLMTKLHGQKRDQWFSETGAGGEVDYTGAQGSFYG